MRVLVIGAYGFIGAHVVAALVMADHEVVCAVRHARLDSRFPGLTAIACDMVRDVGDACWLARLDGIDAVVNCAGILREHGDETFRAIHEQAPAALFRACLQKNVRKVVQISAIGEADDGEFIASKHRGDASLMAMPLDWLVFRPSLVYSARGSYGGTSLLRGLAALPGMLPLPGNGEQPLQPIAAEDVGLAVAAALTRNACRREVIELVGPEILSLRDYLKMWRQWLGFAAAPTWAVPAVVIRSAAAIGERLGNGPFGRTMTRMLERGNLGKGDALVRLKECLGMVPRSLTRALDEAPSQMQDRWHARLYFWLPVLRVSMALVWVGSGLTGWLTSRAQILSAASDSSFSADTLLALARTTGSADVLLGVLCLARWHPRTVLTLMLLMLAGYTLVFGMLWPGHWLDPLGGLLKNLPLVAALAILLVTEERR